VTVCSVLKAACAASDKDYSKSRAILARIRLVARFVDRLLTRHNGTPMIGGCTACTRPVAPVSANAISGSPRELAMNIGI
jgi:hypothetical protein